MSFDCPYYQEEICVLNGKRCTPAKGKCILRNKYMTADQLRRMDVGKKFEPKENNKSSK